MNRASKPHVGVFRSCCKSAARRQWMVMLFLAQLLGGIESISLSAETVAAPKPGEPPASGPLVRANGSPVETRRISGVVISEDRDEPIGNARVRVGSPAMALRGLRWPQAGVYDARTDAAGRFKLEIPISEALSFNAFAPGYEEAAGLWMATGMPLQKVPFDTAERGEVKIRLRPALYVAGSVVDESNHPLAAVHVEATLREAWGYGYLDFDETDLNGRFEIFNFPLQPDRGGATKAAGQVVFEHPDRLRTTLRDVYQLTEAQRAHLKITLLAGHQIKGTILSAAGQPVPGLLVEAIPIVASGARKSAVTDGAGGFSVRGLQGEVTLIAYASALKQKTRTPVRVADADIQVALRLEPIVYRHPLKTAMLFGMRLADVTPELQQTYDLSSSNGVVILDPGTSHFRLGLGRLAEGDNFWMVGNRSVRDLREMVLAILRINAIEPPGQPNEGCRGRVRIVYEYPRGAGTYTQFLSLNDHDLQELMALAAVLQ